MRILTLLLLTMVGAGQTWAMALEPSNIKRGTITGGSIAFYADEACTSNFEGDVAANATVYVKATPEIGNTAIGVTFTAKKGISSDAMQAPRRSAESPGIAADITVSAVTGKPGIYSFTMPNAENTNVTINATFATPAQQQVSYVDENYTTHDDVDAYVLDETMSVLPAGFYVVPNDLTVDHNIESNSGKGSSVTIIIADGKTLTVNGSFGMPCDLSFFGQGNATGKLTINTTTDIGTSLGGRLTVAHVDITSDGGSLGGFNGCIFAGHQTKGNTVTVRSNGDAIGGGSNDVTIKYCNVDLVSETGSCIITGSSGSSGLTVTGLADGSNMLKLCSKSIAISGGNKVTIKYCDVDIINERNSTISCPYDVTIEGVATGNKVNTVIVRSDGSGINTSNPITISYCNVEMTGTTQTDNVYDACGSSGITTSGGVVITGRTDANNTLKIRCGGKTSPNSYGIAGGQKAVSISRYNVNIVNENFYGIYTSDDVTITGGQVEITGGTKGAGIHSGNGIITLGWITPTDYIKASSYYLSSSKAVVFADGQRFVAYNMANANDISATAIVSGTVNDVTLLAGKTLRPLDGNYVSVNAADFTFSGSTSTTSPFTITTGEGETATTTHYYIYKKDNTVTLTYTGSGIVQVTGLPEGTTLAAVEGQPMQRTFTMPATDVVLTATPVTGLTASGTYTYDGQQQTPAISLNESAFEATNYTVSSVAPKADSSSQLTDGKAVNAGEYSVTITGLGQYVGTTSVDFTINPKPVTIATVDVNDKVYDGTNYATLSGTASFVDGMVVEGDEVSISVSGASAMFEDRYVGDNKDATVTGLTLAGGSKDNYTLTAQQASAKASIKPAPVTVKADDKSKEWGTADDPELTATVTGMAAGEDLSLISYTIARVKGEFSDSKENSGEYTITPTGDATQGNYAVTYETGKFTIKGKPVTIQDVEGHDVSSVDDAYTITQDQNGVTLTLIVPDETTTPPSVDIPVAVEVDHVVIDRLFESGKAATVYLPLSIEVSKILGGTFHTFLSVDETATPWKVTYSEPLAADATLQAGTPYIFMPNDLTGGKIVVNNGNEKISICTANQNTNTQGQWEFIGTYNPIVWLSDPNATGYTPERAAEIGSVYGFAAEDRTFDGKDYTVGQFVKVGSGASIDPNRAYLKRNVDQQAPALGGSGQTAVELPSAMRVVILSANSTTGIVEMRNENEEMRNDTWHTLGGRRLQGKPSGRGMYIHNGRKEVIR